MKGGSTFLVKLSLGLIGTAVGAAIGIYVATNMLPIPPIAGPDQHQN